MTITTIDGVPRELLERIAQWGSVTWMDKNELRAILAKPVCGTCNTVIRPDVMLGTACACLSEQTAFLIWLAARPHNECLRDEGRVDEWIKDELAYRNESGTFSDMYDEWRFEAWQERARSSALICPDEPTLAQRAGAAFTLAKARSATASLIMKDIQAYEPDDTPDSVTISVQALKQILLQRLEDFHAAEGDALKLLKPPADPMSATSAVADALVTDQVVGRVYHTPRPALAVLNSCGRALPEGSPLYARPADTHLRYVRAPSRKDPKYHEEWPEIEGGPVFDGVTYCNDLTEALKRFGVIVVETLPMDGIDE